ncbi:hypothetical protein SERLA73DRAFT_191870 [Serpula lacrymans var. lacrymans S7.3]|uniref:PARP catalytic domain-containing protein n=2 Tax=Serpula lacrymans var. lacrymans TaxID=341189 RepID=F8QIH5_SERL3|nr:uncharacterized protein SERLADRAFT_477126 [Serpula lacrymans var. lacrymans S7.9]EGN91900.1 hypothetical protein SERLA73DRAFT_191870 [Serpula lacrymans var. lacrymans S7.3]EGO20699.1 hypothetical protein SERLADRAFT_477126 [Serpula lacrymans var. lacrymans S7.9]
MVDHESDYDVDAAIDVQNDSDNDSVFSDDIEDYPDEDELNDDADNFLDQNVIDDVTDKDVDDASYGDFQDDYDESDDYDGGYNSDSDAEAVFPDDDVDSDGGGDVQPQLMNFAAQPPAAAPMAFRAAAAAPARARAPAPTQGKKMCPICRKKPCYSDGKTTFPYCGKTCAAKAKATLCVVCHAKPRYRSGKTTYPYCGKTCAAKAKGGAGQRGLCDYCHKRPKYHDGKKTYPFCGKSCAAKAKPTRPKPVGPTCAIPGCNKPVYKPKNGKAGKYCSRSHVELAKVACLVCHKRKRYGKYPFCGKACARQVERRAPTLLEVPAGHVMFRDVENQFKKSWRSGNPPPIKKLYKLIERNSSVVKYTRYRASVEARGHFRRRKLAAGNERRRWHGTRRECKVGDPGNRHFCGSATCSLCIIMRTSFDLSKAGKNYTSLRFGPGIYTSSTSATAGGYCRNVQASPYKALLLAKVVVGRTIKPDQDHNDWKAPPKGYDSVVAKGTAAGGDELIVYTNDAARPSYLIVFQG